MKPGDRLVCALVKPLEQGAEFTEWPLHVTIVPWFRNDAPSTELAAALEGALTDVQPFTAGLGQTARFGHNKGKLANLIVEPSSFADVERRVRAVLKDHSSWLVDETTHRRRRYTPHITAQKSTQGREGDTFTCDRMYVIEQCGDFKRVSAIAPLNHSENPT